MSERSEGYSDGYAAGLRWGKRDGDRIAAETLCELHRVQADRDRLAAALAHAAQRPTRDISGLARLLNDRYGSVPWDEASETVRADYIQDARAVIAHLTKGANDE